MLLVALLCPSFLNKRKYLAINTTLSLLEWPIIIPLVHVSSSSDSALHTTIKANIQTLLNVYKLIQISTMDAKQENILWYKWINVTKSVIKINSMSRLLEIFIYRIYLTR